MMRFLKAPLPAALVTLAISAFALASCHSGNGSYTPPGSVPQSTENEMSTQSYGLPEEYPNVLPPCPAEVVPGTYVTIFAQGNVRSGTFTPAPFPNSFWERLHYVATPTPRPTATHSPPPTPTPPPEYAYVGSYTDTHAGKVDTVGCAVLLTTQSGKPLPHSAFNGNNAESPRFTKNVKATAVGFPAALTFLKITNLSAAGGKGTYKLSDGSTGTITFTQRIVIP